MDSLLAQSYQNWELVVVDDGSTDNTAEVVQSYKDSRITYIHQDNKGVGRLAETINTGMHLTHGELVTMFPSDDTWPEYRLEKQVPVFQDPLVVLCYGKVAIIDPNDTVLGHVKPPTSRQAENKPVGSALHLMLASNYLPQTTLLIRREALDAIGGYLQPDGLLAEDYPTHLALAMQGEFKYLDLLLGYYRMHPGQMTRTHYVEMVKTDNDFTMSFFLGLDPAMKERAGWTEKGLKKELAGHLINAGFYMGRRDLLAGDRSSARSNFMTALLRGNPKTKIKAFLGLVCWALRFDLELVARVAGRPPLH